MGFTRSRRYYNHSSGRKWEKVPEENICNYSGLPSPKSYTWEVLPYDKTEKRFLESSEIFKNYWKIAREDSRYLKLKKQHRRKIEYTRINNPTVLYVVAKIYSDDYKDFFKF